MAARDGWRDVTLGEVVTIAGGYAFPKDRQGATDLPFPFFKVSDMNRIGNGRWLRVAENYVDSKMLQSLKARLQPRGTVVFPKVGAALLTNKRRLLAQDSVFDNNVMGLVPAAVDGAFLFYFTQSIDFASMVQPGAVPSINGAMVKALSIALPPLPEQRKIAAILSSVDEVIEKTEAVIESLQALKKAMMQELLTRGLPGRHTRFKQTEIGEVPEEWEVAALGDVSSEKPRYGANVSKSSFDARLPRYVRITDIDEHGALRDDSLASIAERDAAPYILHEGDILLARSGATVGKSYVYDPADGRCAHAGYLICFKPDPTRARAKYVGLVLQSLRYWQWVKDSQRAQAQPNINAAEYSSFLIPLPALEEQVEIEARLGAVEARRRSEAASLAALGSVKSSLMSVLLTGELRVTPDEDAA